MHHVATTLHREGGGYVTDPATQPAVGIACGVNHGRAIAAHRTIFHELAVTDQSDENYLTLLHNERFAIRGVLVARMGAEAERIIFAYLKAHRPHVTEQIVGESIDGMLARALPELARLSEIGTTAGHCPKLAKSAGAPKRDAP